MEPTAEQIATEAAALRPPDQLSAAELAAYLDGRLQGKDLERVETFLAENPESRAELVATARLLATAPEARAPEVRAPVSRRWVNLSLIGAAAAALALVILPLRNHPSATKHVSTERLATSDDGSGLKALSPDDSAVVVPASVRFTWAGVAGDSYQLTVTDAEGRIVWQTRTSDTAAILPATVTLSGPASFYWNVDALAADGTSITTGVRQFRVAAK